MNETTEMRLQIALAALRDISGAIDAAPTELRHRAEAGLIDATNQDEAAVRIHAAHIAEQAA